MCFWSTNVADGQTDDMLSQDRALHYSASRGKTGHEWCSAAPWRHFAADAAQLLQRQLAASLVSRRWQRMVQQVRYTVKMSAMYAVLILACSCLVNIGKFVKLTNCFRCNLFHFPVYGICGNSVGRLGYCFAVTVLKPVHTGDNLSPFRATFVVVFGDYSFGYNLSPVSATFVASVDRLLDCSFLSPPSERSEGRRYSNNRMCVCACMPVCRRSHGRNFNRCMKFGTECHRRLQPEAKEPFRWGWKSNKGIPYFTPFTLKRYLHFT